MVDIIYSVGRVLAAVLLVVLNGFFVAAEFSFVRVRSTTVDQFVEEGRAGATVLREAIDSLDDSLATTQLGITIASLGLGWIGEPAVAALIEPALTPLLPESTLDVLEVALGFLFITFLHVVFGELAPKTIAIQRAEQLSLLIAPPMRLFYYLFVPGIVLFNGTANFFTRLIGVSPVSETNETLQEEELLMLLTRAGRHGDVDMSEVEMIEHIFELDDTRVREVMVPRPDVVSVPSDLPLADLRSTILDAGHTRYPVVDAEDSDQIFGFVDVKDVLRASESVDADANTNTGDLARDLPVVPETSRLNEVLLEFQSGHSQMAAVIDEWGSLEGIATIEDVIEQIVGDIRDEFDVDEREPSIDRRSDGTYLVDGGVSISEVNETIGSEFQGDGFGTVGGLVLDRLGRVPDVADVIVVDNYRVTVENVDGTRVSAVVVREEPAEADDEE